MSKNEKSALWDAVRFTDPRQTKDAKIPGGMSITAVDANWLLQRATGIFGPAGIGFGWDIKNAFEAPSGQSVVVINFWYIWGGERGSFDVVAGEVAVKNRQGSNFNDSDAFKKALTDAVKNALTKIGFLSDIHQGRHDDPEYVAQARDYVRQQDQKAREEAKKPAQQEAEPEPKADEETPTHPQSKPAAELTTEQQINALFIRLKRIDSRAAQEVNDAHKGTDNELHELARALLRYEFKALCEISEAAKAQAQAAYQSAPKAEDGKRVTNAPALLAQLDDIRRSLTSKGAAA